MSTWIWIANIAGWATCSWTVQKRILFPVRRIIRWTSSALVHDIGGHIPPARSGSTLAVCGRAPVSTERFDMHRIISVFTCAVHDRLQSVKEDSDLCQSTCHANALHCGYHDKCYWNIHYLFTTADADNTTNTPRIENFQEVTTVDESIQNVVAFSFDYFTHNISIAENAIFQLRWETADNSSSGLVRLTVTKDSGFNQTNHTTEGAATYRFTVNAAALGEGSLHLTVLRSLRLRCLRYRHTYGRFYSCSQSSRYCTCEQWKYETKAESGTIQISAKKGGLSIYIYIYIWLSYFICNCYMQYIGTGHNPSSKSLYS